MWRCCVRYCWANTKGRGEKKNFSSPHVTRAPIRLACEMHDSIDIWYIYFYIVEVDNDIENGYRNWIQNERRRRRKKEKKVKFRYDCRTCASTLDRTSSLSSSRVMCMNVELNWKGEREFSAFYLLTVVLLPRKKLWRLYPQSSVQFCDESIWIRNLFLDGIIDIKSFWLRMPSKIAVYMYVWIGLTFLGTK